MEEKKGMAVASLILGIISLLPLFFFSLVITVSQLTAIGLFKVVEIAEIISIILGILGLTFGVKGLKQAKTIAKIGITASIIGILFNIIFLISLFYGII